MYNSGFYEDYVANPYASQIGVSSRYALPTADAQSYANAANQCASGDQTSGYVWLCTSANCAGKVNCRPLHRGHFGCCGCRRG